MEGMELEEEVELVLETVPGFRDRYLALVEAADGDPGAAVVLADLADYTGLLVAEMERVRPALADCLAAVERVAALSDGAEELVVWSFFDNLSPDDLRRLEPWIGPRTRSLLDDADRQGTADAGGNPRSPW